jgi:hypothetical protein
MIRVSPPRHQFKFGIRNSEFGIPTQPSLSQRRGAETQRRRGDLTGFLRVARFRPSDGRKPLGRDTAPNTSVHLGVPAQQLALIKRKPRHFSSSFNSWELHISPTHKREERQNRRAPGTAAGGKSDIDESLLSEVAGFSPVTGDLPIVCRSAANQRDRLSDPASTSLRSLRSLRFYGVDGWIWFYLCNLWANPDEWAALRLRGSAPLRFFLCVSVPLWFFDLRIPRSA